MLAHRLWFSLKYDSVGCLIKCWCSSIDIDAIRHSNYIRCSVIHVDVVPAPIGMSFPFAFYTPQHSHICEFEIYKHPKITAESASRRGRGRYSETTLNWPSLSSFTATATPFIAAFLSISKDIFAEKFV